MADAASKNVQEEEKWQEEEEVICDGTSGTRDNTDGQGKKPPYQQKERKSEGLFTKACLALGMGGMSMVEAANKTNNLFKSLSMSENYYAPHECIHLIGGHASPFSFLAVTATE